MMLLRSVGDDLWMWMPPASSAGDLGRAAADAGAVGQRRTGATQQQQRASAKDDAFTIHTGLDQHRVAGGGGVDGALDGAEVIRHDVHVLRVQRERQQQGNAAAKDK